jgi:two-component system LytT family response regulator
MLPQRIAYKSRKGESFVDVDRVDWIEAQGNYVALHVGPQAHLVRDTLANIQRQLDPARFVRIHRRAIVAVDRITAIQPEGNGDATLRLVDGRELRASRSHRKAIRDHWQRLNKATGAADQSP